MKRNSALGLKPPKSLSTASMLATVAIEVYTIVRLVGA